MNSELLNDDKHVRADCKLIERYPVPEQARPAVVARLLEIIVGKRDPKTGEVTHYRPREQVAAVNALTAIEKLNIEFDKRDRGIADTVVNVLQQTAVHGDGVADVARRMLGDKDYHEWLRNRALREDADAGDVRQVGEQGPLEAGPTSGNGRSGPGKNGNGEAP